jgi:hypothetical protein
MSKPLTLKQLQHWLWIFAGRLRHVPFWLIARHYRTVGVVLLLLALGVSVYLVTTVLFIDPASVAVPSPAMPHVSDEQLKILNTWLDVRTAPPGPELETLVLPSVW